MAVKNYPLNIYETKVKFNEKDANIMTIYPTENTNDIFIDSILKRRGWWGKTLSDFMMIFIGDYQICCYNNLNRTQDINENVEGRNLWNLLCSIEAFRKCFRTCFYDEKTDFDDSFIAYSKQIAEIINKKNYGEQIGYGTLCRIHDGFGTEEFAGFGFISKDKWFTFDLMGAASKIIYNDDYFNHNCSSTSVTLYDYIQYHLNIKQYIPNDINLKDRMDKWYSLNDINNPIETLIKKGYLKDYMSEPEPEPESEPEPVSEPEMPIVFGSFLETDSSANTPKYVIGDRVALLGSEDIKCVVENFTKNELYGYTYGLNVSNYATLIGPIDMSEFPRLNWIPECMIVKSG
jgi:hypothetical protein